MNKCCESVTELFGSNVFNDSDRFLFASPRVCAKKLGIPIIYMVLSGYALGGMMPGGLGHTHPHKLNQ